MAVLSIIIVNYQTADLVIDCLASLEKQASKSPPFNVVIVDNASADSSVSTLSAAIEKREWRDWIELIALEQNGGFAYGNNRGLDRLRERGLPAYVVLLNPDTIVQPDAVNELVRFMDQHPSVGIAGSRLEHLDGAGQVSAFRFHSVLSELETGAKTGVVSKLLSRWRVPMDLQDQPHAADWVAGACMIIRQELIEQIDLLDERFFMYFEEVDFCWRAKRAGWAVWYVPAARVVHLVGRSSGIGNEEVGRRRLPGYWFEARQWYFQKNHGWFGAVVANAARVAGHGVWALSRRLRHLDQCDPPCFVGDLLSHARPAFWRRETSS